MDSTERVTIQEIDDDLSFTIRLSSFERMVHPFGDLFDDEIAEVIRDGICGSTQIHDTATIPERLRLEGAMDLGGKSPSATEDPEWMERHMFIVDADTRDRICEVRAERGVAHDDVRKRVDSRILPLEWKALVTTATGAVTALARPADVQLAGGRMEFHFYGRTLHALLSTQSTAPHVDLVMLRHPLLPYFPSDAPGHLPLPKRWGYRADVEQYHSDLVRSFLKRRQKSSTPPNFPETGNG